ncbi:hypothetical protein I79_020654 [Cricetulus griseus]|uniref:Uncharacterized protein n=1 Tax=Cricetulus griseus TaxID=10029 RepID=G3IAM8_CRIGR|nr:hypothetical protein I79_020654 [Cricetulus griseus]
MEEYCLLTFSHGLLSLLFHHTQDQDQLKGSTTQGELAPPISSINQGNAPQDNLMGHFLS